MARQTIMSLTVNMERCFKRVEDLEKRVSEAQKQSQYAVDSLLQPAANTVPMQFTGWKSMSDTTRKYHITFDRNGEVKSRIVEGVGYRHADPLVEFFGPTGITVFTVPTNRLLSVEVID